jgi:hypothetical protein
MPAMVKPKIPHLGVRNFHLQKTHVIGVFEASEFYGTTVEYLGCLTQTKSIIVSDIVIDYYPRISDYVA